MIAKKVIYSGRVQGVGFRYTTIHLSQGLKVAGYVKNLPSGEVELMVEGAEDQVQELLSRIQTQMARNILDTTISEMAPKGIKSFDVRY